MNFNRFARSPKPQFFSSNLYQIEKNVHLAWWEVYLDSKHPKLTDTMKKNQKIEKEFFGIFDPTRGTPTYPKI